MSTQFRPVVDKLLTNVATGYFPTGMVCEQIFPTLPVVQTTGKIGRYGKNHLRITNSVMGGKGKAPQVDSKSYATDSYEIESHGLFDILTKKDYANVEKPFDAERDAVRALQLMMFLGKEKSIADALTDTAIITNNVTLAGNDQFSDYANSDPLAVINTAKETVLGLCGQVPNKLVFDWLVLNKLKYHPQIYDRLGFKFNQAGPLSLQNLADAFEVEQVLVPNVRHLSSKEGQADVLSPVWGKHIVALVAPNTAAVGQVSAGYHVTTAGQSPRKVYKSPVTNPPEAVEVLVNDEYDFALVQATEAVYLIKNAIA